MDGVRRVGLALLGAVTALLAVQPTSADAASVNVSTTGGIVHFSPNGDGIQDYAPVNFTLDRAARVSVVVIGQLKRERRDLGRLEAGTHHWRWNGRIDGKLVTRSGSYELRVVARRGDATDRATVEARLDGRPITGRVVMSRATVYPEATSVDDSVLAVFVHSRWSAQKNIDHLFPYTRVRFTLIRPDGSVVLRRDVDGEPTPAFEWDGRNASGMPVAEGRYVLRVRVLDRAGSAFRESKVITVSDAQLQEEVVTIPVTPSSAVYEPVWSSYCLGCPEYCRPYAGSVYPGGVLVGCDNGWFSGADFKTDLPFPAAPVDTFRVTASGGPSTDGEGTVRLDGEVVLGPGEDTGTTGWRSVSLVGHPHLPNGDAPATWSVSGDPDNFYDIASFTLEYKRWVPVE